MKPSGPVQACNGIALAFTTNYAIVFIALGIQQAKRMRHVMSSVASPAAQYFSTLSKKYHHFRIKMILNMKCVI